MGRCLWQSPQEALPLRPPHPLALSSMLLSLAQQGSTTHTVDTDQRRVPLHSTMSLANTSYFTLPSDPGIIVPGM